MQELGKNSRNIGRKLVCGSSTRTIARIAVRGNLDWRKLVERRMKRNYYLAGGFRK